MLLRDVLLRARAHLMPTANSRQRQEGVIVLTAALVAWVQRGVDKPVHTWPLGVLESVQSRKKEPQLRLKTKQEQSFVFEFLGSPGSSAKQDRDAFRILLDELLKVHEQEVAQQVKKHEPPVLGAVPPMPSANSAVVRAALLTKNPELKRLYKDLVLSGTVSDEDFWRSREASLSHETLQRQAVVGPSNAMIADVQAETDGALADVHYRLTWTQIQAIFQQYPHVERAYKDMVPNQMSQQQFWTSYVQSEMFHNRTPQPGAPQLDHTEVFLPYQEAEAHDQTAPLPRSASSTPPPPTEPRATGWGIVAETGAVGGRSRDYNRHGSLLATDAFAARARGRGLPAPPEPAVAGKEDEEVGIEGWRMRQKVANYSPEEIAQIHAEIDEMNARVIDGLMNLKDLDLYQWEMPSAQVVDGEGGEEDRMDLVQSAVVDPLEEARDEDEKAVVHRLYELLRHWWAAFATDECSRDKLWRTRIVQSLKTIEKEPVVQRQPVLCNMIKKALALNDDDAAAARRQE